MATEAKDAVTMDKIVALCKRRGFLFQSSEIYGGLGPAYDYGHHRGLPKTNVQNERGRATSQGGDANVGRATAPNPHPTPWGARGHPAGSRGPPRPGPGKGQ